MPMLSVHCKNCRKLFPTGTQMSHETFRNATFVTRGAECPHCGHQQTWTLDDVDRSVFEQKK